MTKQQIIDKLVDVIKSTIDILEGPDSCAESADAAYDTLNEGLKNVFGPSTDERSIWWKKMTTWEWGI